MTLLYITSQFCLYAGITDITKLQDLKNVKYYEKDKNLESAKYI